MLHADDLLLQRGRHGRSDGLRAGAGVAGVHHDRRRDDIGVLADRELEQRQHPADHQDDGEDASEDRALNEEGGEGFHWTVL